jgi:hypothetical protein
MIYYLKIRPQRFLIKQLLMSNNCRLAPVINDHLPKGEGSGEYSFDRRKLEKNYGNHPASNITIDFFIWGVTYLLKNQLYMYRPIKEIEL